MPSPISISNALNKCLSGSGSFKGLCSEDVIGVLEYRRLSLQHLLKTFTLRNLGQTAFLETNNSDLCHRIYEDKPEVISLNPSLSLETQGMFAGTPLARRTIYAQPQKLSTGIASDGVYRTFGIARSEAQWLFIETEFRFLGLRFEGGEKAVTVRISESGISEILEKTNIHPQVIWTFISQEVMGWAEARKRLYKDALAVAGRMEDEDHLFAAIVR